MFTIENFFPEEIKIAFIEFLKGKFTFYHLKLMRDIFDFYGLSKEYELEVTGDLEEYLSKFTLMGKRDKSYDYSKGIGYLTYSTFEKYSSKKVTDQDIVNIVDNISLELAVGSHYPKILAKRLKNILQTTKHFPNYSLFLVILNKIILLSENYLMTIEDFDLKMCYSFEEYDFEYFNKYDDSHLVDCIHKTDVICHHPLEEKPLEKLHTFLHILESMDWNNVVLVGGALGVALDPQFNYSDTKTDIDLFVVGDSLEIIKSKTNYLIDFLYSKNPDKVEQFVSVISFTFDDQVVQVISSGYKSGYDLITDTDFSHNMCYYDGKDIMLTPSCMEAFRTRVSRVFKASEPRVKKTLSKGFNIKGACNFQAIATTPNFKEMYSKDELKDNMVYGGLFNSFIDNDKNELMHHYVLGYYTIKTDDSDDSDAGHKKWKHKMVFNCRLNDIDYKAEDNIYSLMTLEKFNKVNKDNKIYLEDLFSHIYTDSRHTDFNYVGNQKDPISSRTGLSLIFSNIGSSPKEGISYDDFHLVLRNHETRHSNSVSIIPSLIVKNDYISDEQFKKIISDIANDIDDFDIPEHNYVTHKSFYDPAAPYNLLSEENSRKCYPIDAIVDNVSEEFLTYYAYNIKNIYYSQNIIDRFRLEYPKEIKKINKNKNKLNKLIHFEKSNGLSNLESAKDIITPEEYPYFDIVTYNGISYLYYYKKY